MTADPLTTELETAVERGLNAGSALGAPMKHSNIRAANGSRTHPIDATMGDIIDALETRNERAKSDLDTLIAGLQRLREEL